MMGPAKNAMEIYQLLDKSNCRQCGFKTCLAFAGAVFLGQKPLSNCPRLGPSVLAACSDGSDSAEEEEDAFAQLLEHSARQAAAMDLAAAAERIGGRIANGRLSLRVLGKEVQVDPDGRLRTDIHVNPWVAGPLYRYILNTPGLEPCGVWVSFRELKDGRERYPLFKQRCEAALKRVADRYPDLFRDMVELFGAKEVAKQFQADISVVLHPLPKLPLMICYCFAEEGIASDLNLFFDRTADQNLEIGAIFNIGAGLAQMFEKIARRHGVDIPSV